MCERKRELEAQHVRPFGCYGWATWLEQTCRHKKWIAIGQLQRATRGFWDTTRDIGSGHLRLYRRLSHQNLAGNWWILMYHDIWMFSLILLSPHVLFCSRIFGLSFNWFPFLLPPFDYRVLGLGTRSQRWLLCTVRQKDMTISRATACYSFEVCFWWILCWAKTWQPAVGPQGLCETTSYHRPALSFQMSGEQAVQNWCSDEHNKVSLDLSRHTKSIY